MWQQDGATPHSAEETMLYLLPNVPHYLIWPPYSPDLSPIEQIWSYIKKRLAGKQFNDSDNLFSAIEYEWNNIPNDIIHNFYSSFYARLVVCKEIGGQCLNGHWIKVKKAHNEYRTKFIYYTDQATGQLMVTESE